MDPENEHLIQQAISELTRGKTIIVQQGTHAQLAGEEGLYRRFLAIRWQAEGWRITAE